MSILIDFSTVISTDGRFAHLLHNAHIVSKLELLTGFVINNYDHNPSQKSFFLKRITIFLYMCFGNCSLFFFMAVGHPNLVRRRIDREQAELVKMHVTVMDQLLKLFQEGASYHPFTLHCVDMNSLPVHNLATGLWEAWMRSGMQE